MPHATSHWDDFQALVLCGPGESLHPFNANPDDLPKALLPIANRPMVWYTLDFCYRAGITNITLICPPSAKLALDAALSQNPYLTALPSPRPYVLAPPNLSLNDGTAQILRLPAVQNVINSHFVVLPCDLLFEMNALGLTDAWSYLQGSDMQGMLGVWYTVKDNSEGAVGVRKEETDLLITGGHLPHSRSADSVLARIEEVASTKPMSALRDELDLHKGWKLRRSLLRRHQKLNIRTHTRDAHIYLFPFWTKALVQNENYESIGEDILGWWAKSQWQTGLAEKIGLSTPSTESAGTSSANPYVPIHRAELAQFSTSTAAQKSAKHEKHPIPSVMAYIHPPQPTAPLLRRVDTVPLLLSASLWLARQPALGEVTDKPVVFAHEHKIHPSSTPAPDIKLTLDRNTVLIDANVRLTSKSTIRESVIGAGCILGESSANDVSGQEGTSGVRISKCLLMDGVAVESGVTLSGCVLGRKCRIGKGSDLKDCLVQEGFVISANTIAKGETFAGFSGGIEDDESDEISE